MPRSGLEARRRLERAALELYAGQGFDQTTTAEIAARAGVTERTFFRHFPDKREVLFGGEPSVREMLVAAVHDAPVPLAPLMVVRLACRSLEKPLRDTRGFAEPRHRLIAAHPALRERELAKLASIADAVAEALTHRGVTVRKAGLAAEVGIAALTAATTAWYHDPSHGVRTYIDAAFDDLEDLLTINGSLP